MFINPNVKLYKVPDGMSAETAVFAELMTVTYALDKAKEFYSFSGEGFAFGDTVVVQGVGPLGLLHVVKARMFGADKIIVIDKSELRLKMAKKFGADVTISMNELTEKERIEKVREETGGRGGDVVVECAGEPEAFPEGVDLVRKGGIYIVAGNFVDVGRTVEIKPHQLCAKNIRILGITNHPVTGYGPTLRPTLRMMQRYEKQFPFPELITHRYKIDDAERAVKKSMEVDNCMKVVIVP